jgi:hypothetical protein
MFVYTYKNYFEFFVEPALAFTEDVVYFCTFTTKNKCDIQESEDNLALVKA